MSILRVATLTACFARRAGTSNRRLKYRLLFGVSTREPNIPCHLPTHLLRRVLSSSRLSRPTITRSAQGRSRRKARQRSVIRGIHSKSWREEYRQTPARKRRDTRSRAFGPISSSQENIGQSDDGPHDHSDQNDIDPNTRINPTGSTALLKARNTAGRLHTSIDHCWKCTLIVKYFCC